MRELNSSDTEYRLQVYDESRDEMVIEMRSQDPILVPSKGDTVDLALFSERLSETDNSIPAEKSVEDGDYIVKSRSFQYIGFGAGEDSGSLGSGVTVHVTPTQ